MPPPRQIRARYDATTLTVYQAYPPAIADAALRAGTFVAPFRRARMTWIKPSFFWMMYRCGWGTKPDQERILAITITREGFEWAVAHSAPSSFDPRLDPDHATWRRRVDASPVRVQWDPERSPSLQPLPWRSVQVGLSGEAVDRYVDKWIERIDDVTALAHALRPGGDGAVAPPEERPYPLPPALAAHIGGDQEPS